ncbi:hypothetical protein EGC76_05075 [Pseudidiomarina gelatinasegens]|jgi:hypothetical protein|uniref:Uncharacterized protein n=1 Tax=Pseudidiomarina gelatinasegens TaxID=2487740 RepID=A0A451GEV3_9GAMM|nr:hypothetical protein [Pseudidiomarina gelatinasegens]RWU11637.1 hypothetical protein EGC76_05075 [Pseudidiomarina gelatinasegens]|tara:strand:- start:4371 stop:4607 length:237 start_codon:yes stop_codon:yes gene_type:complete
MNLDAILRDPSAAYEKPDDILNDSNLSYDEKLEVLEQWEYDALELQVATDENMPGAKEVPLDDILAAKKKLKTKKPLK